MHSAVLLLGMFYVAVNAAVFMVWCAGLLLIHALVRWVTR